MQTEGQESHSEVKFTVPVSPRLDEETTGYGSAAPTFPMSRNVTFAPLSPQPQRCFPVSSTPLDFHAAQFGMNRPMQAGARQDPMSAMRPQPPNVTQEHIKQQRPLLVPDRYEGKTTWKDYHHHFEACKEVNGWSDAEAASYLMASLQGGALRCVSGMSSDVRHSYQDLIRILGRRFGSGRQAENFLAELRHRKQGPRETLQELGQAIHELAIKAYPEIPANSRERLEKNHYIDAIDSQTIREGIHRARPPTLDEAIQAALETENFEKVEMQRRNERLRSGRFTRGLENEDVRLQEMENWLAQRMNHMQNQITEMVSCINMNAPQGKMGASQPQSPSNEARSSTSQWREERML